MQELTKQMRLQEWARQIDDWQVSGMTQKNWCRIHNIGYDAFKYRKAKVEQYASELTQDGNCQIVAVNTGLMNQNTVNDRTMTSNTMEIHLEKATIRISNNVDILLLKNTLEVLADA